MTTFDDLIANLQEIEILKASRRARSMIYQAEAKEAVAVFYGLRVDTFYFLSYAAWGKICEQYLLDGGKWTR